LRRSLRPETARAETPDGGTFKHITLTLREVAAKHPVAGYEVRP
jgi:hypothetical protein